MDEEEFRRKYYVYMQSLVYMMQYGEDK